MIVMRKHIAAQRYPLGTTGRTSSTSFGLIADIFRFDKFT